MAVFTVELTVRVSDPRALWGRAAKYLGSIGYNPMDGVAVIGTSRRPNVTACLAMLLDRSDLLDGAEVEEHTVTEVED